MDPFLSAFPVRRAGWRLAAGLILSLPLVAPAATPDSGACDSWVAACHYTASSREGSYDINRVVIHKTQGATAAGAASWFANCNSGGSAHYSFDKANGHCYQSVREKDIAWHAGYSSTNNNSIGIEHSGWVANNDTSTACYQESAAEVKSCVTYYAVPANRSYIIGHSEVPGCGTPGGGGTSCHSDPGRYWNWSYYMSLIATPPPPPPASPGWAPDSVSWGPGRIDVVKRGPGDNVYHRFYNGSTWSGWINIGALCNGSPTICSMYPGRLDVFMRGFDNCLWHNAFEGQWWGWENLGDYLTASPDCVSRGAGRIDVVFRGSNNNVWHRWMDGWQWVGYNNLGALANSDPAICAMPNGRLDVFFRGFDNNLWHNAGPGNNTWWGWENLGDFLTAGVDAVSRGDGKIDVVFRGSNDDVWHRWMDGYAWVGYNNQGLEANSDPTICSWSSTRLDMFVTGYDNGLWHNAGPGNNTWWGWENLGHP